MPSDQCLLATACGRANQLLPIFLRGSQGVQLPQIFNPSSTCRPSLLSYGTLSSIHGAPKTYVVSIALCCSGCVRRDCLRKVLDICLRKKRQQFGTSSFPRTSSPEQLGHFNRPSPPSIRSGGSNVFHHILGSITLFAIDKYSFIAIKPSIDQSTREAQTGTAGRTTNWHDERRDQFPANDHVQEYPVHSRSVTSVIYLNSSPLRYDTLVSEIL